ncbi:MAG: hypothetical protein PVG79_11055 [Gemmatimonadales bacterium]|jgi:hypothetical protein
MRGTRQAAVKSARQRLRINGEIGSDRLAGLQMDGGAASFPVVRPTGQG